MKCFYHNDNDGVFAAQCVRAWASIKRHSGQRPEFIAVDYRDEFPFDSILPGEQVWIVDYSIPPDEMRRLLTITSDVTWIDHHKTAIEAYHDWDGPEIRGVRRDDEAACILTFKYIHWWTARGDGPEDFEVVDENVPVPRALKLIGDRDTWTWKYGDETRNFCAGIALYDLSPLSTFLLDLISGLESPAIAKVIREGGVVVRYQQHLSRRYRDAWAFEVEFAGHRCLALNRAMCGSGGFGDKFKEYDIVIPFVWDGTQFTISLFSTKVDVGKIAVVHGGGGHEKAAGFTALELPWTLTKQRSR